ncbi:MAG: SemiSWEET transporter [Cyclobacteriaceae bacterium]|nr:SemiSWEET transporter [Cyclobacteriaceae bacterium]
MDLHTTIGLTAAICTTFSFLPQAIKVIKTKNTKGLSLEMYSIFTFGILLWIAYGILGSDVPIIIANVVTLIFAIVILFMKIKYK